MDDAAWPKNDIDRFLLARLEREELNPSPEADRYALDPPADARPDRLAADDRREVDAFVHDKDPRAYEKLVDRLLAAPTYGEHWARMWLDLARYADSAGYADDPPRTIWAYRDYVIRSFNANKPFDQFTIEQIAGDLLPNPSEEQLIATAFHRNTLTNNEGGTERRGVPQRSRRRSRQHDDGRLDGHDDGLLPSATTTSTIRSRRRSISASSRSSTTRRTPTARTNARC